MPRNFQDSFSRGASENASKFKEHVAQEKPTPTASQPGLPDYAEKDMDFLMKLARDIGADPFVGNEM